MDMRMCYVDESGDGRDLTSATDAVTPVCVVLGVVFDQAVIQHLTNELIALKRATHPHLLPASSKRLAWVLAEIKGSDLRRALRTGAQRRNRRHAVHFLDRLVTLLEDYEAKIFGRVWVKGIGAPCDEIAMYSSSMQSVCACFQHDLDHVGEQGFVIADSRTPSGNANVSHSILTQKYSIRGDAYDRVLEMPTFGHSQNHVGIQIADLVASALIFPMATYRYCLGHVTNVHVDAGFGLLTSRYGTRLKALQYRFRDGDGRGRGGITVDDRIGHQSGGLLFQV